MNNNIYQDKKELNEKGWTVIKNFLTRKQVDTYK